MTSPRPHYRIDLEESAARNKTVRRIVAGFSTVTATLAEIWRTLEAALTDTPTLAGKITRLRAELADTAPAIAGGALAGIGEVTL